MSAAATEIGRFGVRATAAEAAAFRAAIGLEATGDELPLTFPMRWLVTPAIRAALLAVVADPALVLVHESQGFDYNRRPRVDEALALTLVAWREMAPDRLRVEGVIADADGAEIGRIDTILRLIAAPAEVAS